MIKEKKILLLVNAILQTILSVFMFFIMIGLMSVQLVSINNIAMADIQSTMMVLIMFELIMLGLPIFFAVSTFIIRAKISEEKRYKGFLITLTVLNFLCGLVLCGIFYIIAICLKENEVANTGNNSQVASAGNLNNEPKSNNNFVIDNNINKEVVEKSSKEKDLNKKIDELKKMKDDGVISSQEFIELLSNLMK